MGLRIIGQNGGATIAESTDDKPVCQRRTYAIAPLRFSIG
jgi:hypothetical protein